MNLRKSLFAVALTALAGSAMAAPPSTAPAAPAKTTVSKHKHAGKKAEAAPSTKSDAAKKN
jgi:hypothetical protein